MEIEKLDKDFREKVKQELKDYEMSPTLLARVYVQILKEINGEKVSRSYIG